MKLLTRVKLASKDYQKRVQAAKELANYRNNEAAAEALFLLLEDSNDLVRVTAAQALGEIGDKRAVGPLIELLKERDLCMRRDAAEALERLDWKPANDNQRVLRAIALDQWEEVVSLGFVAVESLLLIIKNAMGKTTGTKQVVNALGRIGDARAVEDLINLSDRLSSDENEVRNEVIIALARIGDSRAVNTIVKYMNDRYYPKSSASAREAISKMGRTAVDPLIKALEKEDRDIRAGAAEALGIIGDVRAVEPLAESFISKNNLPAAEAMARIGGDQAVDWLLAALDHKDTSVQLAAVKVLEVFADKRQDVRDMIQKREEREETRKKQEKEQRDSVILEIIKKLRVGKSLNEIIAVLGPPSKQFSGGSVLSRFGSVSGSASSISSISERQYYVWNRPEGQWQLVFVGDKLDKIHSTP